MQVQVIVGTLCGNLSQLGLNLKNLKDLSHFENHSKVTHILGAKWNSAPVLTKTQIL